jgi:hypothetical protein
MPAPQNLGAGPRGKQIGVILGIVAASCIILIIWGALMGRKYWNGYVATFCRRRSVLHHPNSATVKLRCHALYVALFANPTIAV